MNIKKIKGVADIESKFVTFDDGSVYVRFDFGGFYEWLKRKDNSLSFLDALQSKEMEEKLINHKSSKVSNLIDFDQIRLEPTSKNACKI